MWIWILFSLTLSVSKRAGTVCHWCDYHCQTQSESVRVSECHSLTDTQLLTRWRESDTGKTVSASFKSLGLYSLYLLFRLCQCVRLWASAVAGSVRGSSVTVTVSQWVTAGVIPRQFGFSILAWHGRYLSRLTNAYLWLCHFSHRQD